MSLSLYNKKRKFSETPEPEGKEKSSQRAYALLFKNMMHRICIMIFAWK
jgi:hypothetical protein